MSCHTKSHDHGMHYKWYNLPLSSILKAKNVVMMGLGALSLMCWLRISQESLWMVCGSYHNLLHEISWSSLGSILQGLLWSIGSLYMNYHYGFRSCFWTIMQLLCGIISFGPKTINPCTNVELTTKYKAIIEIYEFIWRAL